MKQGKFAIAAMTALLTAGCATGTSKDSTPEAPKAPASAWNLVWSDEFDGPAIDTTKWGYQLLRGIDTGNHEFQHYTDRPDNSRIEDGKLVIEAKREKYKDHDFTSARMRTQGKFSFLYGRAEARIKIPSTKGIWPAFWMMPEKGVYGGWPFSGEIDILEAVNKAESVHGTIHYGGPNRSYSGGSYEIEKNGKKVDFGDDFHNYAVEWDPTEMRWYVDGVLYSTKNDWFTPKAPYPAPFDQEFHMILNVAVGGDWPGPPDATSIFPQRMEVDWVRVYQTTDKIPELTITSPANDTTVPGGQDLHIETNPTDPDGTISRVELYNDGKLIATTKSAPWTVTYPSIPDGCHELVVFAYDNQGMRKRAKPLKLKAGVGCPQLPFKGTPISIPSTFQAEDFDEGLEGEAFHDMTPADNSGGKYRAKSGVDIGGSLDGTVSVGWAEPGEWFEYTVVVKEAGTYRVTSRSASATGGGSFKVGVAGTSNSVLVEIPNTGDWGRFTDVEKAGLTLPKGPTVLRVEIVKGGLNIDTIGIVK